MITINNLTLTCKEILNKKSITSGELIFLLDGRRKGLVDFLLIDIREPDEHKNLSIVGTDVLFPVSKMHLYPEVIEGLRHIDFVLYCSTGNRTDNMLELLKKMGFPQACILKHGIISFAGKTAHNEVPANIF